MVLSFLRNDLEDKKYRVVFHKKVEKQFNKLPQKIVDKFFILAEQLEANGPIAANWKTIAHLVRTDTIVI